MMGDDDDDDDNRDADEDDDGDGYKDQDEISCESDPLRRYSKPNDYDGDLIPDCIDTDDDDDGCLDEQDLFPFNDRECTDSDGDGLAQPYFLGGLEDNQITRWRYRVGQIHGATLRVLTC